MMSFWHLLESSDTWGLVLVALALETFSKCIFRTLSYEKTHSPIHGNCHGCHWTHSHHDIWMFVPDVQDTLWGQSIWSGFPYLPASLAHRSNADWRSFFWKLVHRTMVVMCISVMECCLIFSRAVLHFLMPSVVEAVLLLSFSSERKRRPLKQCMELPAGEYSSHTFPEKHCFWNDLPSVFFGYGISGGSVGYGKIAILLIFLVSSGSSPCFPSSCWSPCICSPSSWSPFLIFCVCLPWTLPHLLSW